MNVITPRMIDEIFTIEGLELKLRALDAQDADILLAKQSAKHRHEDYLEISFFVCLEYEYEKLIKKIMEGQL